MAERFVPPSREGLRGHPTDLVIAWCVEKYGARRLADLGCGNGRDALQLIRCGLADFVLGIDDGSEPHNGRIATVKNMVPSDVATRLLLVEGNYEHAIVLEHDRAGVELESGGGSTDLCYSNNVIEHVEDPDDFVRVSLAVAPLALFVLPHERHGWCDDHLHSWSADEFRALMERHGEVMEFGLMADPPPFPCDEKNCSHELMFALVRRGNVHTADSAGCQSASV